MRSQLLTYNSSHSEPHANSSAQLLTNKEGQDAPGKGAQVVYRHDDAFERTAWLPESVAPVFVTYDTREDALVVTEQDCIHFLAGVNGRDWRLSLLNAIWQDTITAACKRHPLPNQFCFSAWPIPIAVPFFAMLCSKVFYDSHRGDVAAARKRHKTPKSQERRDQFHITHL